MEGVAAEMAFVMDELHLENVSKDQDLVPIRDSQEIPFM